MKYFPSFKILIRCAACTVALLAASALTAKEPLNVVLILADDLGSVDLNCYGADDLSTPNIDALAERGVRFSQFYVGSAICSPSRAALLTGRYPQRAQLPRNTNYTGMPGSQFTMAELFQGAGYRTALIGKWHLGETPQTDPQAQGFDEFFGHRRGCIDNYSHFFYWSGPNRHDLWRDRTEVFEPGEYFPDLMVRETKRFFQKNTEQPFFLYLALNTPHYPMQAPAEAVERFAGLPEDRKWTAALLYTWDRALGRILEAVDELGLADNTLVWSSSDHGPSREARNWPDGRADEVYRGGSAGGLRGAKGSVFEGGIRLPAAMRWPGVVRPGSVCDAVCHHADMLPTLLTAVGGEAAAGVGGDLRPLLVGDAAEVERRGDLCWRMGKQRAVRRGPWKLVENVADPDPLDGEGEEGIRLYNLEDDPGERHDCSRDQPQTVAALSPGLAD